MSGQGTILRGAISLARPSKIDDVTRHEFFSILRQLWVMTIYSGAHRCSPEDSYLILHVVEAIMLQRDSVRASARIISLLAFSSI